MDSMVEKIVLRQTEAAQGVRYVSRGHGSGIQGGQYVSGRCTLLAITVGKQ